MLLPASWVDALFARLTVRYGAAFMRQYADIDATAVKADWADVLGVFANRPDAIRHGLEHLPADKPPTVGQFRLLCAGVPTIVPPQLPIANEMRAEPSRVAELVASVKPKQAKDPRGWALRLRRIETEQGGEMPNGRRMTRAAREMWREALKEGL